MSEPAADALVEVHLRQLPVPLWQRAQEQADALLRELALVAAEFGDGGEQHLPARLIALVAALNRRFGGVATAQEEQLFDAADRGQLVIDDLAYQLPPAAGPVSAELSALLDEADDYCRRGEHLLTLAATEEVVAFRRWYLSEFAGQADGAPPVPWPDYAARVLIPAG